MAAFNFPNSPSTNDLHTENSVTWKWDGVMWNRVGPAYTDTTNLNVTGIGTFAGAVNISGVLTYEDVKNVDSVGIITARAGITLTGGVIKHTGQLKLIAPAGNSVRIRNHDDSDNVAVFNIDGNTHLYYDSSHKFSTVSDGIDVVGNILMMDSLTHRGDTNTKIRFPADDTITFESAGSERLRIASDGTIYHNFGRPAQDARLKFDKQATGSCGPEFYESGNQKAYIHLDSEENMVYLGQSGVHHRFYTGGSTESFRVASDGTAFFAGNVGMGNYTTPTAKLSLGSGTDPIKMLLYDNSAASNEKYGFGIQASELRQFFPSNSAKFSLGTISSSDGSTFAEKIRLESSGIVKLSQGATQTNALQSYTAEGAFAYHYVARTTAGSDRYRRMFDIASVGDSTHGSSIRFMTSKDGAAAAIERMRIMHDGGVLVQDDASLTHNANHPHRECPGLLTVHNGAGASNRTNTSTGVYAPPTGGFVNYADYELAAKLITISNSNCNIIMAKNGEPLYINDARNSWGFYNKLPNYLLGLPCTDCVNNSNFTLTLAADMLVFMLRQNGWNGIGSGSNGYPNGWTLIEQDTDIGPANSSTRLYVKSTTMNTWSNWDNDSAMYFFRLA